MAFPHPGGERGEGRPQPLLLGLAERDERAAAALDVERGRTAEQHDMRARNSGGARAGTPGPRQRSAVRLGGIGRREHERVVRRFGP